MLGSSVAGQWTTIDSFGSNMTGLIVGGFQTVIGVLVIAAGLGALGSVANALADIFDSFLRALGRS